MSSEDQNDDKSLVTSEQAVSFDLMKSVYIAEGLTTKQLAKRFGVPVSFADEFVTSNKLDKLKAAHTKEAIEELQSTQVSQSNKLMSIEAEFKQLRLIQLETMLNDYKAYYNRHGHFYKLHQTTGEILYDSNGMPMQLKVPSVINELRDLKETVSLSEGLKILMGQVESVINRPKDSERIDDSGIIDAQYTDLFKKKSRSE